ncbi:MAG: hypothetical protein RO469_02525, partial [Thermincola sp.]|nr:hypothetical protein [Thermincola sp.]
GPIEITSSGILPISGAVTAGISGSVAVSGPIEITSSGILAISGAVTAGISGSVAVSGPIEITSSGILAISGAVILSGHTIVDSGPLTADVLPDSSGEISGTFDVLGYSSWTLAVKYSGTSGDAVHVVLQKSAVSGGDASGGDYIFDSSGTFANQNWLFLTTDVTPRYARLYYINPGAGSGTLYQTFQAQN